MYTLTVVETIFSISFGGSPQIFYDQLLPHALLTIYEGTCLINVSTTELFVIIGRGIIITIHECIINKNKEAKPNLPKLNLSTNFFFSKKLFKMKSLIFNKHLLFQRVELP